MHQNYFKEKLNLNWFLVLLILFIILLDQVTKKWAFIALRGKNLFNHSNDLIIAKGVLRLTYLENFGMVLGIRVGYEIFFTLLATIASILLLWIVFRTKGYHSNYKYALGFILGGAIGNLIDRLLYGKVIDFIYIELFNSPVFNVADIAVTIGMCMGIFLVIFTRKEPETVLVEEEQVVWLNDEKVPSDKVIQ